MCVCFGLVFSCKEMHFKLYSQWQPGGRLRISSQQEGRLWSPVTTGPSVLSSFALSVSVWVSSGHSNLPHHPKEER